MGAWGRGAELLAGLEADAALVTGEKPEAVARAFLKPLSEHRLWEREPRANGLPV